MKSNAIVTALAVLILVAGVGFAGGEQEAGQMEEVELLTPSRIGNPNAELTLEWWVQPDFTHRAEQPARQQAYSDVFLAWAEDNPNVQIEINIMPELEEFKQRLQLAASQGNTPDMSAVDSFWAPWFFSRGYLQPLNEYIPEEDIEDFFPFVIDGVSDAEGNIYTLWHGTDCRVLYYNTDYVEEPPQSWDELFETGQNVLDNYEVTPFVYNGGRWEGTTFDAYAYFWAQGGDLVDMESGRPVFNEGANRDAMIDTLEFLRETVETGIAPRAVATITNYNQIEPYIQADDLAMFVGGNWQINDIKRILGEDDATKWQVANIPQEDPDTDSTGTGGWTWGIFTDDEDKKKAAFDFFWFQLQTDNMAKISRAVGTLPTRNSVYEQVPFFSEDYYFSQFGEALQFGRPRPGVSIYNTISEELQVAMNSALTSDTPVGDLLDQAWENVMAEYNR